MDEAQICRWNPRGPGLPSPIGDARERSACSPLVSGAVCLAQGSRHRGCWRTRWPRTSAGRDSVSTCPPGPQPGTEAFARLVTAMTPPRAGNHVKVMRNGGTLDAMVRAISSATETILFGIDVDGIFGPITDGRVRDFQLTFGATVDGIVGPETWLLLVSPKSE